MEVTPCHLPGDSTMKSRAAEAKEFEVTRNETYEPTSVSGYFARPSH